MNAEHPSKVEDDTNPQLPGRRVDELIDVARDIENDSRGIDEHHTDRLLTVIDTLLYFSARKGLTGSGEETATALTDLLADLMHLGMHIGIDAGEFASIISTASMHAEAEQSEHNGGEG